MSYLSNSSTGNIIDSVLSRYGKRLLTSSTEVFAVTKFALGDDEIPYQLVDQSNIDQYDSDILSLAIPEPSTNMSSELIHKIYVNEPFADGQFNGSLTSQSISQFVDLTSSFGDKIILNSSDTVTKTLVSISTFNQINRPYIGKFYNIKINDTVDCFTFDFLSPVFTDTINNNYTELSPTEFVFSAVNSDGSGTYTKNSSGVPVITMAFRFSETVNFFELIKKPENKLSINVANFLTVTQIDESRQPLTDIRTASMPLQINNNF